MPQKYFIFLRRSAEKVLYKMPNQISQRIEKIIDELETNPDLGSKMQGDFSHLRKIRVSDYRIIYQIFESKIIIEILEIQTRGNVSYDR